MHNKNKNLCLMCNTQQGYYATDSEYFLGLNLQKCELRTMFHLNIAYFIMVISVWIIW